MPPMPPMPYSPYGTKRPSRFVIFILAFLPGLSHMYLGLIKRGLFYISAVALVLFLTVQFGSGGLASLTIFTGFATAALYAVAFFEAFSIRRDIIMGKEPSDVIPNFVKNRTFLLIIAAMLVFVIVINVLSFIPFPLWLAAIAALIVVFALRKNTKK
jgi:hypothetical protein